MIVQLSRSLMAVSILAAIHLPSQAQGSGAEYALRWRAGGPSTAADTVRMLELQGPQKRTVYQVEYFNVDEPPLPGKAPIARRRNSAGKFELTLKYRADAVPVDFDQVTACPLGGEVVVKPEMDILLDAALKSYPVKSISCQRQAKKPIAFPKALHAVSSGCTVTMVRVEVDGFKVEEWEFPDGRVIEVSMKGTEAAIDLVRFTQVVSRLPLAKLEIEDRSKSEAGNNCR